MVPVPVTIRVKDLKTHLIPKLTSWLSDKQRWKDSFSHYSVPYLSMVATFWYVYGVLCCSLRSPLLHAADALNTHACYLLTKRTHAISPPSVIYRQERPSRCVVPIRSWIEAAKTTFPVQGLVSTIITTGKLVVSTSDPYSALLLRLYYRVGSSMKEIRASLIGTVEIHLVNRCLASNDHSPLALSQVSTMIIPLVLSM